VNFSKFCKMGLFIMVKGSVKQRCNSDFYEYKVNSIELIDDVSEKYIKSLNINVPLKALTEDFVKRVNQMAGEYKGKALLKFNVFDTENNMYIEMFSRTTRVNPLDSFLNFFDEQPEMSYRIN